MIICWRLWEDPDRGFCRMGFCVWYISGDFVDIHLKEVSCCLLIIFDVHNAFTSSLINSNKSYLGDIVHITAIYGHLTHKQNIFFFLQHFIPLLQKPNHLMVNCLRCVKWPESVKCHDSLKHLKFGAGLYRTRLTLLDPNCLSCCLACCFRLLVEW